MLTDSNTLRRHEIKRVLKRHYGSQAELARELGITEGAISQWLKGRSDSRRIAEAANAKALALLEQERAQKGAA